MPDQSPFHSRTLELCQSYRWKQWAGTFAVCSYDSTPDHEYFVFRHAAGIIDISPLFKYEITGKDAGAFLARVLSKDPRSLKQGQVTYLCWCDDDGKLIDDGTVTRLDEHTYRVTAAEASYSWFERYARGYTVNIEDLTTRMAAVSVQGPLSRSVIQAATGGAISDLKFFRMTSAKIAGASVSVTRTGYTGDLGYEVWMDTSDALKVWDAIMAEGRPFGLEACGLDAMDITRIEAGFIMNGVDYHSANHCINEVRKSTPLEMGLDWTLKLDREPFNGQKALRAEKLRGPRRRVVGLEISWDDLEKLFAEKDLPPELCTFAWRTSIPVYDQNGRQIGYGSSGAWSPILKKNLALAHLDPEFCEIGKTVQFELTVEHQRCLASARVSALPFFNPERKRA